MPDAQTETPVVDHEPASDGGERPLRILQFLPQMRLELGGPVRAVIDLAETLAARGHRVDVASCDVLDPPEGWEGPGAGRGIPRLIRYRVGSLPGPLFRRGEIRQFTRILPDYDVIHFHHIWRPSILQLAPEANRLGVPHVISTRGMLDDWPMRQKAVKKRLYLALGGRRVLQSAGWVHCTAERERQQTQKWIGSGRITVIPNFMSLEPYRRVPDPGLARRAFDIPDDGVPLVLFLSRLIHNKGPDIFLRAVSKLARQGLAFRVVVAGDGEPGYVARLKTLATSLGLDRTARFVGTVKGDTKLSLLSASTVMALPTCQENFGFVFFEALACGVPLVTTGCVDTATELEASGGTVLADLTDTAFADALEGILRDPARARAMGERGREWAFGFLEPGPLAERFERMYRTAGAPRVLR